MRLQTKIVRVGSARAIALPVSVMRKLDWKLGTVLQVEVSSSAVTIMAADTHKSVRSIVRRLVRENMDTIKWLAKR